MKPSVTIILKTYKYILIYRIGDEMTVGDEVSKTYKMVKDAGFEIVDVIFEGAMTVKGKELLGQLEDLSKDRRAMGVIRIIYTSGKEQMRTIEIPVGAPLPELEE
jgi:hypothetical protein